MAKKIILKLILFYQRFPLFHCWPLKALFLSDSVCIFRPTCSEYTYQAIEKYGILRGSYLSLRRIIRCHPWGKGGVDELV